MKNKGKTKASVSGVDNQQPQPQQNVNPSQAELKSAKSDTPTDNVQQKGNPKTAPKDNKTPDRKALIYNLIIVDESGSMAHLREATLSGINETINTIRNAQNEFASTQEHTLTLVTFDSGGDRPNVRTIIDNLSILEVKGFKDYMPNGCTPLYDAVGESLTRLRKRMKSKHEATAVVTILSDGMENDSTKWNEKRLRALIEELKSEGWSFSYMGSAHDVVTVTTTLSIDNVVEFSHDSIGALNTWSRERSSRRAYYNKINTMYCSETELSNEEILERKRHFAGEYYSSRVSSDHINVLADNEIFVFGSNVQGHHIGGAAKHAYQRFGAVWGQGEGLQGQCYAIPTMEGLASLTEAVQRFILYAAEHPEMRFLVTRVGCGVAGYKASQIAHLFKECIPLENVALPSEFWNILGLTMH